MARVYVATSHPPLKALCAVDQAVGPGCPNERRDVEPAQFFLNGVSKPGGGLPGIHPPGETPLKVDGIFGPKTAAYVMHYQSASAGAAVVDGKVGPIHEKVLTIAHLNAGYAKRFGTERHLRIDQEPGFPADLSSALFC